MLLFLASVACAKKPEPVPVGPDPDAVKAEAERACDPQVPENYQVHTGYAAADDATAAITAAVEDARRRALGALCSGKSPTRCEVLTRHVEAWKQPYWNPLTHQACAHVGIRRDYLDDDQGDQRRLTAELQRLAQDVATKAGTQPLWIEPPTWTQSGCHAGTAGSSMVAELRNGLASAGTVRLAGQAEKATALRLTLDPRATEVVVAASLTEPGKSTEVPLVGFVVPADLFDVGTTAGDCRFDQELGLVGGAKAGSDGRSVRVHLSDEGSYCEGDRIEPVVVVDRPSTVRVFSVARSGQAYLVWPPPGEDGRVEATASLGQMDLVLSPTPGDEKLVAIAGPVGASLGAPSQWEAFCQVPGLLTGTTWAKTAAAGAATFQVQPHNAAACLRKGASSHGVPPLPVVPVCQ